MPQLVSDPRDTPRLVLRPFRRRDTAAVFDRLTGQWYAVGVDWPAGVCDDRPPLAQRLAQVRARLESAPQPPPIRWHQPPAAPPRSSLTRDEYLARVERAKRYIEAGDVYQVNLTRRLSTTTGATPADLYRRLRVVLRLLHRSPHAR